MPVFDRSTLPEEFYDITSAMLLVQPEPQYLHAQLAMAAVTKDLEVGAVGLPGREAPSQGAPYMGLDQMKLLLSDPLASESIKAIVELGKAPGHTVRINRPAFTNSTYTTASREISSSQTISVTPLAVSSEQVAITLKQYAGPYGSSAVQPYAINSFDAKHSVHRMIDMVGTHMKRDWHKWLDSVVSALFDVTNTTIYVGSASADTDMVVAEDHPLDVETLFRAEESLMSSNIPTFGNGQYCCILHPRQVRQLKSDSQFGRYAKYFEEKNPLFTSAVAKLGKLDIFMSNTLNTNASTTTVYKGQVFGPGKVGIGVGSFPRILSSTDDNYSLQSKVIWEAEMGFVNLDNRFGLSLRSN